MQTHRVSVLRATSLLRNSATRQEAYFAEHGRYAPTLETLGAVPTSPDGRVYMFGAERNSYGIIAEFAGTKVTCVFDLGSNRPGEWVLCG
jgi:hypothetical protein